jgi:short-subunit dehydrogenase involved in D-alanine esterification of teichoic acids
LRHVEQGREAAIVNVSSGLALAPKASAPTYCASKAGLHSYTKALRYQLETSGVRVFETLPPLVDTDMTRGRGTGKISADELAREFWSDWRANRYEMRIGKTKLLALVQRLAPALADRIMRGL